MATTANRGYRYPLASATVNVSGDMQNLASDVDTDVDMLANGKSFLGIGTCSLSSTSASYVDITGATMSFTKQGSAAQTNLKITVSVGAFAQSTNTVMRVGVNVNGADTDAASFLFNAANTHGTIPTAFVTITGLAAGTYTVKLRALRTSGAGIITIDNNDTVSFDVEERAV